MPKKIILSFSHLIASTRKLSKSNRSAAIIKMSFYLMNLHFSFFIRLYPSHSYFNYQIITSVLFSFQKFRKSSNLIETNENLGRKFQLEIVFFIDLLFFPLHSEINMNKLLHIHKFKDVIKPKVLCKWEKKTKKERKGKKNLALI